MLVYTAITSLDGFVADDDGRFDWSEPDEEVHRHVNRAERRFGTHLMGRSMYEVMSFWEDPGEQADDFITEYAEIWQGADKIVYSSTLERAVTARTRIERRFDPVAVARLKSASDRDVSIGGAMLAGLALRAGLVDECSLYLSPVIVGGGKHFLPQGLRLDLELLDEHRFSNGVVHVRYRVAE
jgi:dihydrofolate reductase